MFLGIDVGTSEVKVILMDEAGQVLATAGTPLELSRPRPRWSEQAPDSWWDATLQAIDRLKESHRAEVAEVRGVGLSGQMHGATLLDSQDRPLRPAILWNDVRSDQECLDLVAKVPRTAAITGNLAMPGFTAPKLLWVAKHEPEVFAKVSTVLLPKDYIRLRLTGVKLSDMSDSAGTLWLDVAKRDWSDVMLAACKLTRDHMPKLVEGSQPAGELRRELLERWGMRGPVVVAGGGGDNAASAVGIGAVSPGGGFVSLGTSGVTFVVNDRFLPNPERAVHAFCHALPRRWHQMSVMLSAASCLSWVSGLVGGKSVGDVMAEVERLDPGARTRSPIFLPYLSGERSPHNDPAAMGLFYGLTANTDRAALVYAVVEGVTFGLADGVEALRAAGTQVETLSLVGGGSRSAFWAQLIADVFRATLRTHTGGETGAALGAARLAQLACGGGEASVCRQPPLLREYVPSGADPVGLGERLARFRRLYGAVSPIWKEAR